MIFIGLLQKLNFIFQFLLFDIKFIHNRVCNSINLLWPTILRSGHFIFYHVLKPVLERSIDAFVFVNLKSKIFNSIVQLFVFLGFGLVLIFKFGDLRLKNFVLRFDIFQVLKFFFILSNQVGIFSFHFKLHINNIVSCSLLLDENILTEGLNRSEWTEVSCEFLTHFSLLFVKFKIVHHDFKHSLLLLVGFYFLLELKAMSFKILDSCFIQFKMINLTRSNLVCGKLVSMNLSLDILISLFVPFS